MKKNPTFVILQLAEASFDEVLFLPRLLAQLPAGSQCYAMVNVVSSSFASSVKGCRVSLLTEHQANNLHDFSVIMVNEKIDGVIILDLYKYFTAPGDINFLPLWLDEFQGPILALDYFNLLEERDGQIQLKTNIEQPADFKAPAALPFVPFILKPSPPIYSPDIPTQTHLKLWNARHSAFRINQDESREQLRQSLQAGEEDKIVTLFIDPLLFSQAMEQMLPGFFIALIEAVIFYLRTYPQQRFHFLVAGLHTIQQEKNVIPDLNVSVHYFSHLTADNYQTLIAGSDLILSHHHQSPVLLDAMTAGVPAMVMANSVMQELREDQSRELVGFFQPDPALYQLIELMLNLNQWSAQRPIHPALSYPIPWSEPDFPEPGLCHQGMLYHLADTFDDLSTLKMLDAIFQDPDYLNSYKHMAGQALHNEQALSLAQILTRMGTPSGPTPT